MNAPEVLVSLCIPARYGSSRFPGKPLAVLAGKPVIQHVYEAGQQCPHVGQMLVITDQESIYKCVRQFGGEALLLKETCRTGTDRVAKAASHLHYDVIVNLQADEIPRHPGLLNDLIHPFVHSGADIGTLKRKIHRKEDLENPSIVKVVTDSLGHALYFSRSPIPCWRDGLPPEDVSPAYMHLGVYIFKRPALLHFSGLSTGCLEDAEKLEQLRALEHGMSLRVWETMHESLRIDHPEDMCGAEALLSNNVKESQDFSCATFPRVENR